MSKNINKKNICAVHLIRKSNGIEPFKKFILSYKKYGSGTKHSLLLLFKGFGGDSTIKEYEALVNGVEHEKCFVEDSGFDIGSYVHAFNSNKNNYEYFLFINSYSEILCENWLSKLHKHIIKPEIGLVGASGSYQSISSDCLYENFSYGRTFHPIRKPIVKLRLYKRQFKYRDLFPEFPNAHIRTNAFMLSSELLGKIDVPSLRKKLDAYQFESGNLSLTRQIQNMGFKPVIVDASGVPYEVNEWYKSNTFRRNNQENLLISDNQTRLYDDADERLKVIYSYHAWGNRCFPDESVLR